MTTLSKNCTLWGTPSDLCVYPMSSLPSCQKPPVWRHTHVTVVHLTKARGSGLSERSHVFTESQSLVTRGSSGGGGGIDPLVPQARSHLSVHLCFIQYTCISVAKNIVRTARHSYIIPAMFKKPIDHPTHRDLFL